MRQRRERIAHNDRFSPERKPRELKGQRDSQGTGKKNEASRSRLDSILIIFLTILVLLFALVR